jgi:proline racemase
MVENHTNIHSCALPAADIMHLGKLTTDVARGGISYRILTSCLAGVTP